MPNVYMINRRAEVREEHIVSGHHRQPVRACRDNQASAIGPIAPIIQETTWASHELLWGMVASPGKRHPVRRPG